MLVDELEPGVDDSVVADYAEETDRVVLTHDVDYFTRDCPTLFVEDRTSSAFEIAGIVTVISRAVSQEELAQIGSLKVVRDWL